MEDLDFLKKETFSPEEYKKMVKVFQENDNPTGWFDKIYQSANGDYKKVFGLI